MSLPLPTRSFCNPRAFLPWLAAAPALFLLFAGAAVKAQSAAPTAPEAASGDTDLAATAYRGGPGRTGFADQEASPPLSIAWQNTGPALAGNQSTPVIDNGVIFFGTAGRVYAVNAGDGSVKWVYPSADVLANPDVAHPGLFDCPATVSDGKVIIGNDDHNLYALDENTGALAWQVNTGGYVRSAPIVQNGVVYFGSGDSKLYAIREDNQKPVWGGEFRTTGQITTPAAVAPGNVYFVDVNDTLYSAALSSGRLVWSLKFENNIVDSPPVLGDGVVIVAAERDVYGVSPSTGSIRWHFLLPATLTAQVALSGDGSLIYAATSDDDIVAVDQHGHVQWTAPLGSATKIAPVVTNNTVVAVTNSGVVRVLDAATGAARYAYTLFSVGSPHQNAGTNVTAVPLVTAGAIYTLADNGTLTALRANAIDDLPPTADLIYPVQNKAVAGAQIRYAIFVNDIGSGIDPSSLAVKVDNASLPVVYDLNSGYITIRLAARGLGQPAPVALPTLSSGAHALTLSLADWRGNRLVKTWNFTVNDALNPVGSALPANQSSSGNAPDASAQGATGSQGAQDTAPGGGVDSGTGSNTAPGGSSGSGSGTGATSGAQPTGSGGAGAVPTPSTAPGPVPSTPTGAGAVPAAPPGAGNFPPPPPI